MAEISPRYQQVYELVRQIPPGQVATYGQIAELLGWHGQARQVGYALFRVDPDSDIPWHRVINAQGKISQTPQRQGSDALQRLLLMQEAIMFDAQDTIDLRRYRWQPVLRHAPPQESP
ncbi:methyltransferase [Synechococcales cyanobacterium C]|uniref:Methyltransferase n=1 Tax=Petrachloros mirabilis ULC683 TaxID=2781853 RepID=A0A8K2A842_9CYAN|nr:MGMT family protein [Petrachloros mirabilis]NCJ06730.1 methyltransferase [Petrachloros mirabilis ULC683]